MKVRRPLQITLLGAFECRSASGSVLRVSSRKSRALLAFLATRPGQHHSRDALAALLWSELTDARARANLRQELFVLQRDLRDHADALLLDGQDVTLDATKVETDLAAFERAATGSAEVLATAGALYTGDLLAAFGVPEPAFEDWLRVERERVRGLALDALERWVTLATDAGRYDAAVEAGRRALAMDPVRESVHRALMRMHDRRGERAAVARQYQACVDALRSELDTRPRLETTALYRELMSSAPAPASPRVAAARPARVVQPRRPPTPLVGREAEIARLTGVRDRALAGSGAVLLVLGEAGIGKTRIVDELTAPMRAGGVRVLAGHCYATEDGFALSAWIDALQALVGDHKALAELGATWRAELGILVPELSADEGATASGGSRRLFEAVGRVIDALAATGPLVVVLEDIHWADDATVRLLAFVARRIAELPVLLLVTSRDEEPEYRRRLDALTAEVARAGVVESQVLRPLSREGAEALALALRRGTPAADEAGLLDVVWRTSEGNPLAVVETVRAVTDGSPGTPTVGEDIPTLVRALIRQRLRRLPEAVRRVLDVAALIGRTFELRLLQEATALAEAEVVDHVEELVRRRLLDDRPHGIDFAHERIREVTRQEITASRRRPIHAAVAAAMETVFSGRVDEHAHALAVQWREAQAWDKAGHFFWKAGDVATRRGGAREALGCYDEALAALDRMPESAERLTLAIDVRIAYAHSMTPLADGERMAHHIRAAEELCRRLQDPRRLNNVLGLNTRHAINWCDPPALLDAAERAHTVALRHGDAEHKGDAAMLLSLACTFTGDARRGAEIGRRLIAEGLDESRPWAVFTAPRQTLSRAVLAWGLVELGEFDEARQVVDEGIAFSTGRRGPYPLIIALVAQGLLGVRSEDAGLAVRAFTRAVELGHEAGYTQFDLQSRAGAAIGRARQGLVAEGVAELEAIAAELAGTKIRLWITLPRVWLAEAYLRAGRIAAARAEAESALALARSRGERILEGWALCMLAESVAGDESIAPALGLTACADAIAIAEAGGLRPLRAHCELTAARLHARAGDRDAAREAFARAREVSLALHLPLPDR